MSVFLKYYHADPQEFTLHRFVSLMSNIGECEYFFNGSGNPHLDRLNELEKKLVAKKATKKTE